jgi:hypothetical protein
VCPLRGPLLLMTLFPNGKTTGVGGTDVKCGLSSVIQGIKLPEFQC